MRNCKVCSEWARCAGRYVRCRPASLCFATQSLRFGRAFLRCSWSRSGPQHPSVNINRSYDWWARKNIKCTSKTSWEAAKSSMEFCIADKMPRLTFKAHSGSSTDGQRCSICPSWKENTSGCCSSPAANWAEPDAIDRFVPSRGSDCSNATRLSWANKLAMIIC